TGKMPVPRIGRPAVGRAAGSGPCRTVRDLLGKRQAMRQSEAAVALIRREQDGQTVWLAQWNDKWRAYHFVSGHKRSNETFRECLVREVAEELGLKEGANYTAAPMPAAHLEFTAFSQGAGVE